MVRSALFAYCTALCLLLALAAVRAQAGNAAPDAGTLLAQPERIPGWLASGRLRVEQIPDPHWRDDACLGCHSARPEPGNAPLRQSDSARLCGNCHDAASRHSYLHPSGARPGRDMLERMPASYRDRLEQGRVTCTTCHDLPAQCLPERRNQRQENPMFLRDGPFAHRTDACYLCHDASQYARINPHEQVDRDGSLRKATCALCHSDVESLDSSAGVEGVGFNIRNDLARMCTGCHPWIPHPGGTFMFSSTFKDRKHPEHLAVPPREMRRYMQRMAARNGIILPLDPTTGKVYCATCHNPHARGVIEDEAAARGAGSDKRLRMKNICTNCHNK